MTIGFVGSKAADVEALLSNFRLTEVVIGEGGIIDPDPKLEINTNAVYDEESGNISVSWTSNKQDGTFDVLMSEDGKNFVSVGAVENVTKFVYTPENDFETLYFKVVQIVGEQTAESNVVAVAKSAEDIAISAEANYDKETGKITVSWTSNKENGIFEVFVSEDGENFTSVDTVEDVTEFIYSPNNEFDVLYFKIKQTIGELSAESNVVTVDYQINWADKTDKDNDRLPDVYEKYYFETDPTNPDTDGDGLPDGYEVYYFGTDPKKADTDNNGISDSDEDFDKDGLSNLREYELGTDPSSADSDSDGLTDGEEVNKYNTDPLKYDTDNDGISDGDEVTLGLDPASAAADGIPDSERTFVQHIGEDSDSFAAINTSDNPYKVSIDITAAGVAANNLSSHKSGYSNVIKNDAILGISPEFVYTDGLKVEDVIINFDLDNSVTENTNGKYTNVSDEFAGIKRYNVFKFFEDTNMLLPIETFHDVENNRVYTHVDELGTYCIMDMEIWLEGLEIAPEDFNSVSKANQPMLYSLANSEDTTEEDKECLDVVLVAYPHKGLEDTVQKEMVITSNQIFTEAEAADIDVRIFYISFLGSVIPNLNDNTSYATNMEDAQNMIKRIPSIPITFEPKDYALYKSMKCITSELSSDFREDSNRFCFVVDALAFPKCSSNEAYVGKVKDLDFNVHFVYSAGNENYSKYLSLSTDHICSEILVQKGRYNFGDFIVEQIFGNVYPTVTAVGWTQVELNSSLQQNYEWYQKNTHYNEFMDTDHDGLADYQEIKFATESGRSLVDDSDPMHVELLTFAEIVDLTGDRYNYFDDDTKRFYVKDGLKRYMDMTGEEGTYPSSLALVHILPIRSDPTNINSDYDKYNDYYDLKPLSTLSFLSKDITFSDTEDFNIKPEIVYCIEEKKAADKSFLTSFAKDDLLTKRKAILLSDVSSIFTPLASQLLRHYLDCSGKDYELDVRDLISNSSVSNELFQNYKDITEHYVYSKLIDMDFNQEYIIVSDVLIAHYYEASIRGILDVNYVASLGQCSGIIVCKAEKKESGIYYSLRYMVYDYYDYEKDKEVAFFPTITDGDMYALHEAGLAKSFYVYGEYICDGKINIR